MSSHPYLAVVLSLVGSALVLSVLVLEISDVTFFLEASIPVLIVMISGVLLYDRPSQHKPLGAVVLAFSLAVFFLLTYVFLPPPSFSHTSSDYGLFAALFLIGPGISAVGGFLAIIWRQPEQAGLATK